MASLSWRSSIPAHARAGPNAAADAWKLTALALFAGWILLVGSAHEPWFDEAQAWLLARDNGLAALLFDRVRYEGTPGLWHAILWFAIRAGLPYTKLYLVSAAFAIAGAAVVLWRAPFPSWVRVGVIFSYFFAYQYSVIARSYSVDLLLLPLTAAFFASRSQRPLRYAITLGLLANLNAHGFVIAAALGAELLIQLFREQRLRSRGSWIALGVGAFLALFALVCAWQPADNNFLREQQASFIGIVLDFVQQAFLDRLLVLSGEMPTKIDQLAGFAVLLLCLLPTIKLIASGPARLASGAAAAALLILAATTYASPWHTGLLFLLWVVALWISWPAESTPLRRQALIGVAIILCAQAAEAGRSGMWDISQTFSSAREATRYLDREQSRKPDGRIGAYGLKTFAMQPYWRSNGFANYKKGSAKAAWVDWRRGEPWDPFGGKAAWETVLSERPDWIVASLAGVDGNSAKLKPLACAAGYVEAQEFRGSLIWRGSYYEDDSLAIFARDPAHCPAHAAS